MNLGIDFGSTYTTITTYDNESKLLHDIYLSEGTSPFIPSVATLRKGTEDEFEFGEAAKQQIGKKNYRPFKAFKMMLPVEDDSTLEARGYDKKYTPELITKQFFDYCIGETLSRTGNTKIDRLVIGVPECWNEKVSTMDGRSILRKICKQYTESKSIEIVSEPAAASAYFAYNYKIQNKKNYEGHILLIDYGGGTLDITLTEVRSLSDGSMEIEVVDRTGAGENEEREIGTAGIVFMESVVKTAIMREEQCKDEEILRDGKFFRTVNELEQTLKSSQRTRGIFNMYEDEIDHLDEVMEADGEETEFTTVEYKGEELSITYGMLADVYRDVISDSFAEQLEIMVKHMERHGILTRRNGQILWNDKASDKFKVALVGGFANFDLVGIQVKNHLDIGALDCTINDALNREKAVSMGAALLAGQVISIKNTARYSIGLLASNDGHAKFYYGIRYKQEIEFEKPYFPLNKDESEVRFMIGDIPRSFIICTSEDESSAIVAHMRESVYCYLKSEMSRISREVKQPFLLASWGFSIDHAGVISIHVRPIDQSGKQIQEDYVIPLSSYKNMFVLSELKQIREGEVYTGWN